MSWRDEYKGMSSETARDMVEKLWGEHMAAAGELGKAAAVYNSHENAWVMETREGYAPGLIAWPEIPYNQHFTSDADVYLYILGMAESGSKLHQAAIMWADIRQAEVAEDD